MPFLRMHHLVVTRIQRSEDLDVLQIEFGQRVEGGISILVRFSDINLVFVLQNRLNLILSLAPKLIVSSERINA